MAEQPMHCLLEIGGTVYLDCASGSYQPIRRVAEVPDMRPEDHGGAIGGRLDHVLSAPPTVEAAADKCHVGQTPKRAQLADGVYQNQRGGEEGRGRGCDQLTSSNEGQARALEQTSHFVEAFPLPGHEKESQARKFLLQLREDIQYDFFFRILGA